MRAPRAHGSKSAWSTAAVIFGIVAAGTVVAGLLNDPEPEPIAIPGCDEVVQPEDMERINFAFTGGGSFDNSDVPWRFEDKAQAMTDALAAALPAGSVVEPDSFAPVLTFEPLTGVEDGTSFGIDATAFGSITVGGRTGRLTVTVGLATEPPGPCFAGFVDERSELEDGTVLDTVDRKDSRSVVAHTTDGTRIDVSANGVLTLEQVVDIATAPGLRASAPA